MSQPSDSAPLDADTITAMRDEVASAKARGWLQADLKEYFESQGVSLADYLAAARGEPVTPAVRSVLAAISIAGLPPCAPSDPYPDVPSAMKAAKRWLLWRYEPNDDSTKKPRKVPVYANGERRSGALDSPGDVARLVSYAEAVSSITPAHAGLGFALGLDGEGAWQGIDLDNLDQHPGLQFVAEDLPGYTEKSPSGQGMHAIGYGRQFVSLGSNTTGIEAYAAGRYFTVTGESTGLGEIADIADFVEGRLAPLHSPRPQDTSAPADGAPAPGGTLLGALAGHDLRSALTAIRADDRDVWIRLGHALKSLGEQGRALWLEWSQTSDKYDPADAARVWGSFKPERTGHQAVFAEAQRCGWANPATGRPPGGGGETGQNGQEGTQNQTDEAVVNEPPPMLSAAALIDHKLQPRPWFVEDMIPGEQVTTLDGDGGLGKSTLGLQLGVAAVTGQRWLGQIVQRGKVIYVAAEDDLRELHRRLLNLCTQYRVGLEDLSDLHLWPLAEHDPALVTANRDDSLTVTRRWRELEAAVAEVQPALLVLDSRADVFGGNEVSRAQARGFIGMLRAMAVRCRMSVLILAHPSLSGMSSGSGSSGSTHWRNAVRAALYLTKPEPNDGLPDPDARVLEVKKSNYGPSGVTLKLRWSVGSFVLADAPTGLGIPNREVAQAGIDSAFLRLLVLYGAQGRTVSDVKSANFAPAVFAEDPASGGFTNDAFRGAMNRLFAEGAIAVEEVGPPSKRRRKLVRAFPQGAPE